MSKKTLPTRIQYLSPEQIDETVDEIADLAREQGVSIALVGGYALQLYGSRRLTVDVDFCADGVIKGLRRGEALTFGGQQVVASNGVVVDLIIRTDGYRKLYRDALVKARRMQGVNVRVASVEHLLAMKLQAGRGKDLADLEFIISQDFVNIEAARKIVERFVGGQFAVDELDSHLLEAEFMKSKLNKNKRRR